MSNKKYYKELYEVFSKIKNEKDAAALLDDLLTPQELEKISERVKIIKNLKKGFTQRKIAANLGVSVSKVTRGSNVLKYGRGGLSNLA